MRHTHGLSDSLISVLATRGGEVVESVFGKEMRGMRNGMEEGGGVGDKGGFGLAGCSRTEGLIDEVVGNNAVFVHLALYCLSVPHV